MRLYFELFFFLDKESYYFFGDLCGKELMFLGVLFIEEIVFFN